MLGLVNKQKEVKPKHQKREFWYRLDPGPFELLTDRERDQLQYGNLFFSVKNEMNKIHNSSYGNLREVIRKTRY